METFASPMRIFIVAEDSGGTIERIRLPKATVVVKGLNKVDTFLRQVVTSDHTTAVGALIDWIEERIGCCASTAVGQF